MAIKKYSQKRLLFSILMFAVILIGYTSYLYFDSRVNTFDVEQVQPKELINSFDSKAYEELYSDACIDAWSRRIFDKEQLISFCDCVGRSANKDSLYLAKKHHQKLDDVKPNILDSADSMILKSVVADIQGYSESLVNKDICIADVF